MKHALLLLALLAGCGEQPHEPVRVIAKERPAPAVPQEPSAPPSAPVTKLTVAPAPPPPAVERSPMLMPTQDAIPAERMGNDALRAAVEARLAKPPE